MHIRKKKLRLYLRSVVASQICCPFLSFIDLIELRDVDLGLSFYIWHWELATQRSFSWLASSKLFLGERISLVFQVQFHFLFEFNCFGHCWISVDKLHDILMFIFERLLFVPIDLRLDDIRIYFTFGCDRKIVHLKYGVVRGIHVFFRWTGSTICLLLPFSPRLRDAIKLIHNHLIITCSSVHFHLIIVFDYSYLVIEFLLCLSVLLDEQNYAVT